MRSKRSRFLLILVVLGICFACLWPSIRWYACTSKEDQNLALGSLEKIRDYSRDKADVDVKELFDTLNKDAEAALDEKYSWLKKIAVKNYKAAVREANNGRTEEGRAELADDQSEAASVSPQSLNLCLYLAALPVAC